MRLLYHTLAASLWSLLCAGLVIFSEIEIYERVFILEVNSGGTGSDTDKVPVLKFFNGDLQVKGKELAP